MATTIYPPKYLELASEESKNLVIVVQIDGVPFYLTSSNIYSAAKYGDPGLTYGEFGLVYGGLGVRSDVKPILNLDGSMTISQKIEPEQGRGAIQLLSLSFTDKDGYMSQVISPNIVVDELLGNKFVRVWLGFQNSSFPDDYLVIMRGYISGVKYMPSKVDLQIADPNLKRKTNICDVSKTSLSNDIDNSVTTIPVVSTENMYEWIASPPGPQNFSPSAVNTSTDTISLTNHSMVTGSLFQLTTSGTLPAGLSLRTNYYAIVVDDDNFKVATTLINAQNNNAIDITTQGTGTHTLSIYDAAITTYIKIGDEYMEYGPNSFTPTAITVKTRGGVRGTTAASHANGDEVTNSIQIQDNVINIALKMALSGWDDSFTTGVACSSIVDTQDGVLGFVPGSILLPAAVDADLFYGLTVGDWVTISGSIAGNNGTYKITLIEDVGDFQNRLLVTNGNLNIESPASTVALAFRSQYDTYPVSAGARLTPHEVDVTGLVTLQNQFLSQLEYRMRFLIQESINLKTFTESELFLPIGMYSITRFGRLSGNLTHPPIAGEKLITIDSSNITDHQNTSVARALNSRRFFSEVDYSFDLADDNSTFQSSIFFVDSQSLSKVTISTPLPITSKGLRSDLGASTLVNRQATFLNRRYNNVAHEITLNTNFGIASQIESGDVVALDDGGTLKIVNFNTGSRNIGAALYEVIDRKLDLKTGKGTVTLLSTVGIQVNDRFGTISPSSIVGTGSSTTRIKITPSFGIFFGNNEYLKWTPTVGLPIVIHSLDYSTILGPSTFTGVDPTDSSFLLVSPALSSAPTAGMIVEIEDYPTDTNQTTDQLYKDLFCHIDPTILVSSGTDNFNFTVALGDVGAFHVGAPILIHNTSYSILSPEALVTNINSGTGLITVDTDLGFTPASGQKIELIGFADFSSSSGGPYRIL